MKNTLLCPACGKEIEISEALKYQIQQEVLTEISQKHKKDIEEVKKQVELEAKKETEEKLQLEMIDLKRQVEEKNRKVDELQNQELKLREEKRRLEEKEKELKLEVERRIDEETKKVEEKVLKQALEAHHLKDLEKEKIIHDLTKALEDAQRKAHQSSQQLQGEVLELDLEGTIRASFPQDAIEPVGKGVRGADIRQTVKSPRGYPCGVILWETKRTKVWADEWTAKLKSDLRQESAHIPVIVSTVLPKGLESGLGLKDGVWVVSFTLVLPLAILLRTNLLDLAYHKAVAEGKGRKADTIYSYITGHEFRQQVEALVEVYQDMQEQLLRERAAFEKNWKVREMQVRRLLTSTARVYGTLHGLVGSSLPHIKGLELPEPEG